jgi:hypothetical protein
MGIPLCSGSHNLNDSSKQVLMFLPETSKGKVHDEATPLCRGMFSLSVILSEITKNSYKSPFKEQRRTNRVKSWAMYWGRAQKSVNPGYPRP